MPRYDRTRFLKPGWELKPQEHIGSGHFPTHTETGEVCECKNMQWNAEGTLLLCPRCGMDGT